MDVQITQKLGIFSLLLILAACAPKSADVGVSGDGNNSFGAACPEAEAIKSEFLVTWDDNHISLEKAENKAVFAANFLKKNRGRVRYVEYNQRFHVRGKRVQVESETLGVDTTTWGQDITNAAALWSQNVLGQGIKVAVVDAGVDYSQVQIKPRLAVNTAEMNGVTGVDDDGNGYVDDIYGWDFYGNRPTPTPDREGHGTHVAGIIAADHSKGVVQGMAPSAQIVPANFMDANGSGDLNTAVQAIQYVASRGVKVINASWGGCSDSVPVTLRNAIAALESQNILFVAAAGNDGADLDGVPDYPSTFNLNNQLTIAASTSSDFMASFSNSSYNLVHLAAPGQNIYSTLPNNKQGWMSGTSMATPFVSGAAALLWSAKPSATVAQIKQALMNSVDSGPFRVVTQGRLNVQKALTELNRIAP